MEDNVAKRFVKPVSAVPCQQCRVSKHYEVAWRSLERQIQWRVVCHECAQNKELYGYVV